MSGGVWYMLMVSGASLVMSGACLVVFVVSGVVSGACQVVSDACLVRVSWCLEHVWCMSGGVGITGSDMPSALSPVFNTIS